MINELQKIVKTGQRKKRKMAVIKMQKEDSELNNRRAAKNGENRAAKEEEDDCHKNAKTGQRRKIRRKGTQQGGRRPNLT